MKFTLRDYQIDGVNVAVKGLREERNPFIIQAATGAGKSLMIAEICHQINEPILILQPSKEILEQNYKKLLSYDLMIDAGIYSASVGRKEIRKFTFATIGSIYKKPHLFEKFKYVILDECHRHDPKNLNGMLTTFLTEIDCKAICGLTATPYRIDTVYAWEQGILSATMGLKMVNRITHKPFFKKILYKIETAELIEQGYLSPIEYFVDQVDLDELVVNTTGADYTTESLEKFWNQKRLSRIAAAVIYSDTHNSRSLVFCSSIRQAESALAMIKDKGIGAEIVTGKTPKLQRERILRRYAAGEIKHLFNVGVFTTGFDMPQLDCIVMARPTMSLALYYQMIGRGVRLDPAKPNKVLQVYDLVGVVERLGRVETIRVQKEADTPTKKGFKDEVWSERGRMDGVELRRFKLKPKKGKTK